MGASGFLALYVAEIAVGSDKSSRQTAMLDVFAVIGWLVQIVLFRMLGLLVLPYELLALPLLLSVVMRGSGGSRGPGSHVSDLPAAIRRQRARGSLCVLGRSGIM